MILWNFWDIVYPIHNEDYIEWSLAVFGVASGFSDFFIMFLLPMTLADKNRLFAYELTMLGTIIALVNLAMFMSTSLFASFAMTVIHKELQTGNIFNRILIIVLLSLSTWVFWSQAWSQLDNLRWRRRQSSIRKSSRASINQYNISNSHMLTGSAEASPEFISSTED